MDPSDPKTITAVYGLLFLCGVGLFGWIFWSLTGAPMMRNYAECGTVFMCSAQ